MRKQNKLLGKIILANFLEYGMKKFITFIDEVEGLPLYKRLAQEGIIIRNPLPGAEILRQENAAALAKVGVIAEVRKGVNLSIRYTRREFSIEYQINDQKPPGSINNLKLTEEDKKDISGLLYKLRRINTRNLITHEILKGILNYQKDYFESNNELALKPLTMTELARIISNSKESSYSFDFIDVSRISRVIRRLSVITPQGEEVPLTFFFASRKDMVKRYIKAILNKERKDIFCSGQLKRPYTDEELRHKLNEEYGLLITRRGVAHCRQDLGISPYSKRNGYVYRSLQANFSNIYPFTLPSVKNNAPECPGVYELRLVNSKIDYPNGSCEIFYIGSGKNLRKRLLSHLSSSSKNGGIKELIKENSCAFRYVQLPQRQGWGGEEKRFFNFFVAAFGDSPLCNHVSPKGLAYKRT